MERCKICGKYIYQCERCGGTGQQQAGEYWTGGAYVAQPAGPCRDCEGQGRYIHGEEYHRLRDKVRVGIHHHYDQLLPHEKNFVDQTFRLIYAHQANVRKDQGAFAPPLASDDRAERAVDAVAKWVIESR